MPNPFENWLKPDVMAKFTAPTSFPGVIGMKDAMESGRKSVQACAEAQQLAMESLQTIIQRQTEIVSRIMHDNSAIAQEIINEGTPEEKIARSAEMIRNAYERTIDGMQEVGDIYNKSGKEACEIINRRVAACFDEIGCCAKDAASKKTKAKKSA